LPNIHSLESSTSNSTSSRLSASNSSSLLSVEISTIAPNTPA
ncbi:9848_t:CDS:1, partial [Dentiscutata erythropus]